MLMEPEVDMWSKARQILILPCDVKQSYGEKKVFLHSAMCHLKIRTSKIYKKKKMVIGGQPVASATIAY